MGARRRRRRLRGRRTRRRVAKRLRRGRRRQGGRGRGGRRRRDRGGRRRGDRRRGDRRRLGGSSRDRRGATRGGGGARRDGARRRGRIVVGRRRAVVGFKRARDRARLRRRDGDPGRGGGIAREGVDPRRLPRRRVELRGSRGRVRALGRVALHAGARLKVRGRGTAARCVSSVPTTTPLRSQILGSSDDAPRRDERTDCCDRDAKTHRPRLPPSSVVRAAHPRRSRRDGDVEPSQRQPVRAAGARRRARRRADLPPAEVAARGPGETDRGARGVATTVAPTSPDVGAGDPERDAVPADAPAGTRARPKPAPPGRRRRRRRRRRRSTGSPHRWRRWRPKRHPRRRPARPR